jgi:hypothetical protein
MAFAPGPRAEATQETSNMADRTPEALHLTVAAVVLGAGAFAALAPLPASRARAAEPGGMSEASRTLPWTGGDHLWVSVSADVRYVQGPDAKVTISGPRRLVDRIVVRRGVIAYEPTSWWGWWGWGWRSEGSDRVRITVTAPHLEAATLSGSGRMDLGRLSQDRLDLNLSGSGEATAGGAIRTLNVVISGSGGARLNGVNTSQMRTVISGSGHVNASGACDALRITISGSGAADTGALACGDVDAVLSGSGWARIAPKRSADVHISGSGGVDLATEPARLTMQTLGSGHVTRPNRT